MKDYADKTKLFNECARRTPIYRANPVAEFFAALLLFVVLIIANFL